jgi:hypothetical protein
VIKATFTGSVAAQERGIEGFGSIVTPALVAHPPHLALVGGIVGAGDDVFGAAISLFTGVFERSLVGAQ